MACFDFPVFVDPPTRSLVVFLVGYEFVRGLICAGSHMFVFGSTHTHRYYREPVSVEIVRGAMQQGRKGGAKQWLRAVRKSKSQQDRQFEERLRIAERLVRALRKAGYSCDLGSPRTLRRDS